MILIDADLEAMFNHVADGIATEAGSAKARELLCASLETRRVYRDFYGASFGSALRERGGWFAGIVALFKRNEIRPGGQ